MILSTVIPRTLWIVYEIAEAMGIWQILKLAIWSFIEQKTEEQQDIVVYGIIGTVILSKRSGTASIFKEDIFDSGGTLT